MSAVQALEKRMDIESGREPKTSALSEGTYIELVRSLFTTLSPTIIMALSFFAVGLFIILRTADIPLRYLFGFGIAASAARIALLLAFRKTAARVDLDAVTAGILERRFACVYISFAIAFGAFVARAFVTAGEPEHMLLVGLIFGYGAGVASGISLRPWISIPSVLIAITPMIAVSLFMETASYWGTGLLTTAFLAGGIESMLKRYRAVSRHITMHRLLSTLARSDTLTGLPNRLSLNEWFVQAVQSSPATDRLAVYCVALDHIQAINDTYGYPVGDALLKAVAERLNRIVAPGDFLIRLNGVKFAIVQFALLQSRQGDLLAQHIVAAIAKPFSIEGQEVSAGACIGYTIASQRGADLDYLLGCADHAIQQAKREASNVASYSQSRWGIKTGQAA